MTTPDIAELVEQLRRLADEQQGSLENDIWCFDEMREAASALEHLAGEVERLRGSGLSEAAKIVQVLGEKNPHMDATWLSGVLDAERAIRRAHAALFT